MGTGDLILALGNLKYYYTTHFANKFMVKDHLLILCLLMVDVGFKEAKFKTRHKSNKEEQTMCHWNASIAFIVE